MPRPHPYVFSSTWDHLCPGSNGRCHWGGRRPTFDPRPRVRMHWGGGAGKKGGFTGVNSVKRCLFYPPFQKKQKPKQHGCGVDELHFIIAAPVAYAFQPGSISPFKRDGIALNWRTHASDTLWSLQCCFFQRPCATRWIVFNSCGGGQGQNLDPSDPTRGNQQQSFAENCFGNRKKKKKVKEVAPK